MKPITNVFPAHEGSEKGYSVNRGESTLMLVGWRQDSSYVHHFTLLQRHIILLEIVAVVNSKKNRNIKANDVNLIWMVRSTDFCFKTTYVGMFLFFRLIVHCFQCLVRGLSPFEKKFPVNPPYPSEITTFKPPLSLGISNDLPWGGGGGWIFSGTTHCAKKRMLLGDWNNGLMQEKNMGFQATFCFQHYGVNEGVLPEGFILDL